MKKNDHHKSSGLHGKHSLSITTNWYRCGINALLRVKCIRFRKYDIFIAKGSVIAAPTWIGQGTRINGPFITKGTGEAVIGKYNAIGERLTIITNGHDMNYPNIQFALQMKIKADVHICAKKHVRIDNNVWIGDGVIILPGVTIGDGAVIGAGAIVTKSVQPYTIVAGNPAHEIRKRYSEEAIQFLLQLKWWDWPLDRMQRNVKFFNASIATLSLRELRYLIVD